MSTIKVSFVVPHEVYGMLQASAARAGLALPVFVRDVVFTACQIDVSSLKATPRMGAPKLTRSKRDVLTLLQNHAAESQGAPYLTTHQISGSLQQCDQSIYLAVRALVREGLLDRGQNVQRTGNPGAPLKSYTISELGKVALSDDQTRVLRVHEEFQARSQAAHMALMPLVPQVTKRVDDSAVKASVHGALRYIAMAQLGRAIESEADVDAMKVTHGALCKAADTDVAAGAHTYAEILARVTSKIASLGGNAAISERFNIG